MVACQIKAQLPGSASETQKFDGFEYHTLTFAYKPASLARICATGRFAFLPDYWHTTTQNG
jgi:hypothetical protein